MCVCMYRERIREGRKGNAEREPGAIAIQCRVPMTCICISPSRGLVIIAMNPLASCSLSISRGSPLPFWAYTVYIHVGSFHRVFEKRSHRAACRRPADDADRDNNIVTLSLHAQPTHTYIYIYPPLPLSPPPLPSPSSPSDGIQINTLVNYAGATQLERAARSLTDASRSCLNAKKGDD